MSRFLRKKKKEQAVNVKWENQLGLEVLAEPASLQNPVIDIIFVHGLGGSRRGTWKLDTKDTTSWPEWLPKAEGLDQTRVSTFGYDAEWDNLWKENILDISAFAQQLLDALRRHHKKYEKVGSAGMMFVAHSMGGLVVKKALIMAHLDPLFEKIKNATLGIAFIATPHRGSDLAKVLGAVLKICFSQRKFIGDLTPAGQTINEINNDFKNCTGRLVLFSFLESRGMPFAGVIVPPESATLGYPGERTVALNGDHTSVVKFSSPDDSNYKTITENLALMIQDAALKGKGQLVNGTKHSSTSELTLTKSVSLFCVPFDRNVNFTGQARYLDNIVQNYRNPSNYNHRIALFGLGGVGKSQIALHYCFQYKSEYTYVFWISGAERQKLLSGFRDIASEVKDIGFRPDMSPDVIAKMVIKWLESTSGWLLVIDNLDDISVAGGYLPAIDAKGHTLVTSRDKHINEIAEAIEIMPMDPDEATALLLRLVKDPGKDPGVPIEATTIVKELGFLPLAIDHAAAYIRVTGDIFNYLQSYRSNTRELLNWRRRGYAPDQITVATTWDMSLKRLKEEGGNSTELIRLLAFLNPDEILVNYLKAGAQGLKEQLRDIVDNQFKLTECIDTLATFSLIGVWNGGKSIRMHRLVQWVIRDSLDLESRAAIVDEVIGLSLEAFPACDGRNIDICRQYFRQIMPSLPTVDKWFTESVVPRALEGWDDLLERVALNLQADGYTSEALPLLVKTFEVRKKYRGAGDEKTLDTAIDLATAYANSNRVTDAEELFKTTLDIIKKTGLGDEGLTTLRAMEKLAFVSRNPGSEAAFREVWDLRKRVQGPEHRDTLHTEANVAMIMGQLGRVEEARALHLDILARKRRFLDEDDEEITYSLNWLAEVNIELGHYIEAEALLKEALERRRRLKGSRHPRTLWNIDVLARTYNLMGWTEDAEKLEKEKAEALMSERRPGE